MASKAIEDLHKAALGGDGEAHLTIARLFDSQGNHQAALEWLNRGRALGHLPSMTYLGARLLTGRAAPLQPIDGAQLVADAARSGHGDALALMSNVAALGLGRPQSWSDALSFLARAAQAGHQRSAALYMMLGGESADLAALLTPPAPKVVLESPRIGICEQLLPKAFCDWIIERARGQLAPSRVYDPEDGERREGDRRTNTNTGFAFSDSDLVLLMAESRLTTAMGLPYTHQEPTNILHYDPGEEFAPHFDFLNPAIPELAAHIEKEGQRIATGLIYLNDNYDGGETEFPELRWRYRGRAGDAVFFLNVTPDGQPDPRTVHAGLPTTRGEKWVFSKWMRDRPWAPV